MDTVVNGDISNASDSVSVYIEVPSHAPPSTQLVIVNSPNMVPPIRSVEGGFSVINNSEVHEIPSHVPAMEPENSHDPLHVAAVLLPVQSEYLPPQLPSPSAQGAMLYKVEPLHPIVTPNRICDTPMPKNPPPSIPSPVLNKLKKLGTSVELENPNAPSLVSAPCMPQNDLSTASSMRNGFLEMMLHKAGELTSNSTNMNNKSVKTDSIVPSPTPEAELQENDNLTKFSYKVDASQVMPLLTGDKLFSCDICMSVYSRGFSLKRHYLKTHINYKHISKRDLHNCGIISDPSIEKGSSRKKHFKDDSPPVVTNLSPPSNIPDLYRCHKCNKCFMLISELKTHFKDHPEIKAEEEQPKRYTCPKCNECFRKKKLLFRHKETCMPEIQPPTIGTHLCLFCDQTFLSAHQKKVHLINKHHPKRKVHSCFLCKNKTFKERILVFKHLVLHHPHEFYGCVACRLRFVSRVEYKRHKKQHHRPLELCNNVAIGQSSVEVKEDTATEGAMALNNSLVPPPPNKIDLPFKCTVEECPKWFISHTIMSRHYRMAHRPHPRLKKKKIVGGNSKEPLKVKPKSKPPTVVKPVYHPPPPSPPTDPEVLFYSNVAQNIRENLTHHLDGKLDSQEVMENDFNESNSMRNNLLNFSASTSDNALSMEQESASTLVPQSEGTPTPINLRTPWEKFDFPKKYDGMCGLTSYIKEFCHLDISTQVMMRQNLQRLQSSSSQQSAMETPANFPAGLLLVEKPVPDLAETFGDPDDGRDKVGVDSAVLSGEWVRPRYYICAACGFKSASLYEVEDHKYALHPNVKMSILEIVGEGSSSWDWIYHRRLPPGAVVETTTPLPPAPPYICTSCGQHCPSIEDLHSHILACYGDTTWSTTMLSVTTPGTRRRKWRQFGSRRRKNTGRRGLKRNIPNTPTKHACGRMRTKPGDMDTIQKMLANLPPKRATRRVMGDDMEIITRSQATISSYPISSLATHPGRSTGGKSAKSGKNNTKGSHKKVDQPEIQAKKKIKEEPADNIPIKKEVKEDDFPLEAENTVQHSDIMTSLQMIRVVRTNPGGEHDRECGPSEKSKIIAAMREAMLTTEENQDPNSKTNEKKTKRKSKSGVTKIKTEINTEETSSFKKVKIEEKSQIPIDTTITVKKSIGNDSPIFICTGCGMEFESTSACQRHKKKCVYWKEEDSKKKCEHCGSVFPHLMALIRHNCNKGEEPTMPELCPVKPVEETLTDSVEEIPILSPAYVARDETAAKRISLLEETIRQVGEGSFDFNAYMDKLFKKHSQAESTIPIGNVSCTKQVNPENSSPDAAPESSTGVKPQVDIVAQQHQNVPATTELNNDPPNLTGISIDKSENVPDDKQVAKIVKVSEIFKEVKKRGRKRQKNKTKVNPTFVATKLNCNNSIKKLIAKQRRKRSSNFVLLMQEWEKLEKEGAVAVGKRKRPLTRNDINTAQYRSCRNFTPAYSRNDFIDTESVFTDTSSCYENMSPVATRRKSRRTNSVGSLSEPLLLLPSEEREQTPMDSVSLNPEDLISTINVKTEPIESHVKPKKRGRPPAPKVTAETEHVMKAIALPLLPNEEREQTPMDSVSLNHEDLISNVKVKTEPIESHDQPKKRGRPPGPKMSAETEQHVMEAIDLIINKTLSDIKAEIVKVQENIPDHSFENYDLTKVPDKTEQSFNKSLVDDHINKTIEGIINESKDFYSAEDDSKLKNLSDVIYNVSIGNIDAFEKQSSESASCSYFPDNQVAKNKQGRKKKKLPVKEDQETSYDVLKNQVSLSITQSNDEGACKSDSSTVIKSEPNHLEQGKRKLSLDDSSVATDSGNTNLKPVKTKQLLIENYLSNTNYGKSLETINKIKQENHIKDSTTLADLDVNNHFSVPEHKALISKAETNPENKEHRKPDCGISKQNSPSCKEDLSLSIKKEKAISRRKRKLKLLKLLKKKHLDIVDKKLNKMINPKLIQMRDACKRQKRKKLHNGGLSRNRWEVSIVETKQKAEVIPNEEVNSEDPSFTNALTASTPVKHFYCPFCCEKFESAYHLYEHQQTQNHKEKVSACSQQPIDDTDDTDPVKYCKSIGNIINDLEKRTLNVAKVMHNLKQKDTVEVATSETVRDEVKSVEESSQQDWFGQLQEGSSSSTTSVWEGATQGWDGTYGFTTGSPSSLGSIIDTVNKLLSDQELVSTPSTSYSWTDLQVDMGASDEEMAILEQLGQGSLQEEAYVYDNSQPQGGWPQPEDNHTLTDLDHPQSPAPAAPPVAKQETLSDAEESKCCRGNVGRPRRMLGDYENSEMVCPNCTKHFLGLTALQKHMAWKHCPRTSNPPTSSLKHRALLSGEEVDSRLVCVVCKEIVPTADQLEAHIQAQHAKRLPDHQPAQPSTSESAKLKSKMSLALGGLVDKALEKLLGTIKPATPSTSHPDLNTGALQLINRICAVRKHLGNENLKLSADLLQLLGRLKQTGQKEEMRTVLNRGRPAGVSKGALQASVTAGAAHLKPTNLLDHLAVCSSDLQDSPYACPICKLRFVIPSTRNRHMARAHGQYGRRYDEEADDLNGQDDLDSGWKDSLDPCVEANDEDGGLLPQCSDCGLSFQSIQDVIQHRIEDHPRRFTADVPQEDSKASLVYLKSSEMEVNHSQVNLSTEHSKAASGTISVDSSTSPKKRRGRPPKPVPLNTEQHSQDISATNQKLNVSHICNKNNELKAVSRPKEQEICEADSDSLLGSIEGNSNKDPSDQNSDKVSEALSGRHSSEESLAELSKRLDRRKVKGGKLADEYVKVKAEAALRELNLGGKSKQTSSAKWGINAMKFTKQMTSSATSVLNGSPSKPRFKSLGDKKWKNSPNVKQELAEDVKSDIYDFNDEDASTIRQPPFHQSKESPSHSKESPSQSKESPSQSNSLHYSSPLSCSSSSLKKPKLSSDNS